MTFVYVRLQGKVRLHRYVCLCICVSAKLCPKCSKGIGWRFVLFADTLYSSFFFWCLVQSGLFLFLKLAFLCYSSTALVGGYSCVTLTLTLIKSMQTKKLIKKWKFIGGKGACLREHLVNPTSQLGYSKCIRRLEKEEEVYMERESGLWGSNRKEDHLSNRSSSWRKKSRESVY